jgi:hypothetical protein
MVCKREGFALQSNGEAFASLDQVKNSRYSKLEGRQELFERVSAPRQLTEDVT